MMAHKKIRRALATHRKLKSHRKRLKSHQRMAKASQMMKKRPVPSIAMFSKNRKNSNQKSLARKLKCKHSDCQNTKMVEYWIS